ncbi:class I SAM-dependent methyltransferase [archaeon]|nr:class I SAM-dependent methyltransferase [archaeon]
MSKTYSSVDHFSKDEKFAKELSENDFSTEIYKKVYDKDHKFMLESNRLKDKSRLYGSSFINRIFPFLTKIYLQKIIGKKKRVLEVACGDGFLSIYLAKKKNVVSAIDISNVCIDLTKLNIKQHNVNVDAFVCDGRKLPFLDNSFDYVLSTEFVEHLREEDFNAHLAEVRRVLKNGGSYVFVTPNAYATPDFFGVKKNKSKKLGKDILLPLHFKEYTYKEIKEKMPQFGFEPYTLPIWLFPFKQPLLKINYKVFLEKLFYNNKFILFLFGINKVIIVAKKIEIHNI